MESASNVQKMMEALKVVRADMTTISANLNDAEFVRALIAMTKQEVEKALSLPLRQCDVGTPEEQKARFYRFCEDGQHTDRACCGGCPIVGEGLREKVGASCELAWAQKKKKKGE